MAWAALFRDAFNGGREAAWWASGEATLARFENPKQGRCSVLLLDPPVDLRELRAKHGRARGVEVRSWFGACPDEVLEDWARLTTLMEEGAPMGDLTRPATRSDLESVRLDEQRMQGQCWLLVRSIARLAGVSVGYTQMFRPRHDPEIITQDDTLVDRAHRGHGVGRALKLADLENLSAVLLEEAASAGHGAPTLRPGPLANRARWIQTCTALGNAPMLGLNRAFGTQQGMRLPRSEEH